MYTHLTTYFSSVSIYPASKIESRAGSTRSYTVGQSTSIDSDTSNWERGAIIARGIFAYSTLSNGFQDISIDMGGSFAFNDITSGTLEGEDNEYFVYTVSTFSSQPYSIIVGNYSEGASAETNSYTEGASSAGSFTVSHLGTSLASSGQGRSTSWDGTGMPTIEEEYNYVPTIFLELFPPTIYTAPSFTTESTTIVIVRTTESNINYTFLGSIYNISTIIGQTTNTTIEFQTTKSVPTNIHHHIGTSINTNNSEYTLITDTNSDGKQISPYACFLSAPNDNFLIGTNISTYSQTIIISNDQEFRQLLPVNAANTTFLIEGVGTFSATATLTNQYTEHINFSDSSLRMLDYLYNGNTGSFETEETSYTSRATGQELLIMSSRQTSQFGVIFTSSRATIGSATIQTQMGGILQGQRGLIGSSISFNTISKTNLSYYTETKKVGANFVSYSLDTFDLGYTSEDDYFTSEYVSATGTTFRSAQAPKQLASTERNIDVLIPASQTIYNASVINDEHWAGYGNIYKGVGNVFAKSFLEQPKIYYFKNRITYNASKLLENNGIFSSLNSQAYKDFEFPAIGIGDKFITTIHKTSNTEETELTTLTRKILAGVSRIYDPAIFSFILPDSSSITNTSFTSYTTWQVAYSNPSITKISPNGLSETIPRAISFTEESFYGYNDADSEWLYPQFNKNMIVSPNRSVRSLPDWITIGDSGTFTGESDDIFISLLPRSYYVTEIKTEIDSFTTSSYTTTYAKTTFSTSNLMVLRPIDVFRRRGGNSIEGIQFLGGYAQEWIGASGYDPNTIRFWDTGVSYSNTIFNFTSYIGSTYIDV